MYGAQPGIGIQRPCELKSEEREVGKSTGGPGRIGSEWPVAHRRGAASPGRRLRGRRKWEGRPRPALRQRDSKPLPCLCLPALPPSLYRSLPAFTFSLSTPFLETSLQRLCTAPVPFMGQVPTPRRTPIGELTPRPLRRGWWWGGGSEALGAPPRPSAQPQRPPSMQGQKKQGSQSPTD